MLEKQCSECQEVKPLEEFNKNKNYKDGYAFWCRSCVREYNKQYRLNNPEKVKEVNKRYYIDNAKKLKESQKQYRINNLEKTREKDKQYRINHHKERMEYEKQYRVNHREKKRESGRKYAINNPEKIKEYKRLWVINNPERKKETNRQYRINNPEQKKEYDRQYSMDHLKEGNERSRRRAALKRNSTVERVDLLQLYENHKWICGICGLKIDKKLKWPNLNSISHDHIIPISKGGSHTYDNIQPAHLICNIRKKDIIDNIQLVLQTV